MAVALTATACSEDKSPPAAAPSPSTTATTEAPPPLAFSDEDEEGRPTLRVSVPKVTFVAPHAVDETDPVQVLVTDLMTDGLTERDPVTGRARPALADDWSVSADRLTWTFTLRSATFSNGDPIRAIDVATSLNRLAALGPESLSGPTLAVVDGYDEVATGDAMTMAGVEAIDDTTLAITLTEPYEPLPELLAGVSFGVFPVDIDTRGTLPLSSSITFRPTAMWEEGFRMAAEDSDGTVGAVEIWIDPTGDLIESGDVDVAVGVDPADDFADGIAEVLVPRSASAYFAFNVNTEPFGELLVRQAVMQSVDRDQIRDDHFPDAIVMDGLVVDSVAGGVDDACGKRCTLNGRAAARKIRRSETGGSAFTVDFFVDDEDAVEQRLAQDVVASLRAGGLNATARGHTVDEYGELVADGELPMFRFGSVTTALVADAALRPFLSESRDNVTGLSMPEFDALVLDARATVDHETRDALYADAEAMLFENAVLVPVVRFQHRLVHATTIDSISLEPDGSLDLDTLAFAG